MRHLYSISIAIFCLLICFCLPCAEAGSTAKDQYTIGINDQLRISVLEHPDLTTIVQVTADGTITFPYIGSIVVKGMTLPQIEVEIAKRLAEGYIKYPMVSATLMKFTGKKFYVTGEIFRPGEYPYDEELTVIKAISVAGGVTPNGLYGKVKVKRKQKDKGEPRYKEIIVDLKGTKEGSVSGDMMPLQAEDIIVIERNKTYFVQGEVTRTGEFILADDMTIVKAVSLAGGVNPSGLYGKVKVRRKQEGEPGYKDILINLKGMIEGTVGDIPLQPDDIVIVERSKIYHVHGEVGRTGEFILEDDMTVVKAISVAGGITSNGLYGKVKVRRKQEGEPGYKDIPIDLKGAIEGSTTGDTPLQPDDILIVEANKKFFIYGEINRPGEFVLEDDMTILKALSLAGGLTKWGSSGKVKILRIKEGKAGYETIKVDIKAAMDGDAKADILIQPGDTVVVSAGVF